MTLAASTHDSETTDTLHCISCGYLLYGLDTTGNCPECGTAISTSANRLDTPLVAANPRWLNRLVIALCSILVASIGRVLLSFFARALWHSPNFGPLATGSLYWLKSIIVIFGCFMLASRDPSANPYSDPKRLRWFVRFTAALWLASTIEIMLRSLLGSVPMAIGWPISLLAPFCAYLGILLLIRNVFARAGSTLLKHGVTAAIVLAVGLALTSDVGRLFGHWVAECAPTISMRRSIVEWWPGYQIPLAIGSRGRMVWQLIQIAIPAVVCLAAIPVILSARREAIKIMPHAGSKQSS